MKEEVGGMVLPSDKKVREREGQITRHQGSHLRVLHHPVAVKKRIINDNK